jgi:hypothetical protein
LKEMVPYEAWTGRKFNVGHLKVFGCGGYVHVPKTESKKLGDRGTLCIFVGYDEERKGYRLINPKSPHKVIVERSVIFDETLFPALNKDKVRDECLDGTPSDLVVQLDEPTGAVFEGERAHVQGHEVERRYPARERKPRDFPDFVARKASLDHFGDDPETREEALSRGDEKLWERAMRDEIISLKDNDVWTLVPRPPGKKCGAIKVGFQNEKGL